MQVYLVGGAVRDRLLNHTTTDKDFVVVGATVAEMIAAGFEQVGANFPVFLHPRTHQEYALARTERKKGQGYQGFEVHASPDVSLEDDLKRRDLTINALAMEVASLWDDTPITGEVIDYYGGLDDLHEKTLRHVSAAFAEDPLRVLRVARFYGRYHDLGFTIAEDTLILMRRLVAAGELGHLSAERIWQESSRATMQRAPHVYWQLLDKLGALTAQFAPLADAWTRASVKETVCTALAYAGQLNLSLSQRWALLLSSLKPELYGVVNEHSVTAASRIQAIGQEAKVPKTHTQFASLFVDIADDLRAINTLNASARIDLISASAAHKSPDNLSNLLVTAHMLQLACDHQTMHHALKSYHAIGIDDIDPDLQGAAIGKALRQARIEHLTQQHSINDIDA